MRRRLAGRLRNLCCGAARPASFGAWRFSATLPWCRWLFHSPRGWALQSSVMQPLLWCDQRLQLFAITVC